jgi:hypothetical protein
MIRKIVPYLTLVPSVPRPPIGVLGWWLLATWFGVGYATYVTLASWRGRP